MKFKEILTDIGMPGGSYHLENDIPVEIYIEDNIMGNIEKDSRGVIYFRTKENLEKMILLKYKIYYTTGNEKNIQTHSYSRDGKVNLFKILQSELKEANKIVLEMGLV